MQPPVKSSLITKLAQACVGGAHELFISLRGTGDFDRLPMAIAD